MYFDPTPSRSQKRPFAQQPSFLRQAKSDSPKVPRFDSAESDSPFSLSRKTSKTLLPSGTARGRRPTPHTTKPKGAHTPSPPFLDGPLHDHAFITREHRSSLPMKPAHETNPKSSLANFAMQVHKELPNYTLNKGVIRDKALRKPVTRCTVAIDLEKPIIGIGDHADKKEAEKLAALSAIFQLHAIGILDQPGSLIPKKTDLMEVTLSENSVVRYERARSFMDYYCRRYGFGKPDMTFEPVRQGSATVWDAVMTVGGRRIGLGSAGSKKSAQVACYLDVTQYLESCDPELWKAFVEASKSGADIGLAPRVFFQMSDSLDDEIRDLCSDIKASKLWRNRPAMVPSKLALDIPVTPRQPPRRPTHGYLADKSNQLLKRYQDYLASPAIETMRKMRESLPIYTRADEIISHIEKNEVTICMASTGSGKTTQVPQLILDAFISRGRGAQCNIVCTQPRRLAAISVAHRVAKERGEVIGKSIGYHVRFEAELPEEHGSINFCTTGVLLKRLQSSLSQESVSSCHLLDDVTHIIVDEVHERDVDNDLLLVVLKRLLADRKAKKKPLKVILMSATIDPGLFQQYFPDETGRPAAVVEVPGRSFPVNQYFLDDFISKLVRGPLKWILQDESVVKYLVSELGEPAASALGIRNIPQVSEVREGLELPYPLIAATISHVIKSSNDGHVLVFLPGWDEIMATQRLLQSPQGPLCVDFNDLSKFAIHLLHSTIPLAEQQAIFDPPPQGIRRIILATNIAETSITIPDVVYVVDSAKVKEQRYDPERHMSSLVSAWVGKSNLKQRAGRAGRHRSGEYFGILGRSRADTLSPYQTVEMKRVDLSNIVMHVKALDFPGMTVDEVLAAAIEPPLPERVAAAMKDLQIVGALDADKNLTSLGRVLLQLPVDAQVGRLVLYGSFFRCLDEALTLAAILTNRDPFVSPIHLKSEAAAKKNSWTPHIFRSDALAILQAFNAWWAMQSRGEYVSANKFCVENFLAKPTLLMIQKIKGHLLYALYQAGVIDISAGGLLEGSIASKVPPQLNVNSRSLPLLAALISIASQPKFAIRVGKRTFRTSQDKITFIHPSSINDPKKDPADPDSRGEKQLFAFAEKRRNISLGNDGAQTFLVTTTRLDPMSYMLFGAHKLQVVETGLECDSWLPVVGNLDALDDIQHLKTLIEGCMLRVFEGITMGRRHQKGPLPTFAREESESGEEAEDRDYSLSGDEVRELDTMTQGIVRVLDRYSKEEYRQSPPGTPMEHTRFLAGSSSGYSTPRYQGGSVFYSRPNTPSKLHRRY